MQILAPFLHDFWHTYTTEVTYELHIKKKKIKFFAGETLEEFSKSAT